MGATRPIRLETTLLNRSLRAHDRHANKIRKIFRNKVHYEGPPLVDGPLLLLAFTNRSGSNLLADRLRSTGHFSGFYESLNHLSVERQKARLGSETFPEHIARLHRDLSVNGTTPGFKASWSQLAMLLRWNIPAMFDSIRIIHIRRQDVLDQAISFTIAHQTLQWSSKQRSSGEAKYSYRKIATILDNINHANNAIASICSIFSLERIPVLYEDLIARPESEVKRVAADLGFDAGDWVPEPPSIDKQATEINREFRERFAAKARAALIGRSSAR